MNGETSEYFLSLAQFDKETLLLIGLSLFLILLGIGGMRR